MQTLAGDVTETGLIDLFNHAHDLRDIDIVEPSIVVAIHSKAQQCTEPKHVCADS